MIDFLFITSPSYTSNPHPPYYFMYLAAYLKKRGLQVKIIDPKGGDSKNDIEEYVEFIRWNLIKHKARFVGLSAFHNDYPMMMRLGELIKDVQSESILLVGGPHATIDPQDFIYAGSPFDIAVMGEGEETCYELWKLAKEWIGKEILDKRKTLGIAYMGRGKELIKTQPRPFIDPKDIAIPAYNLIDMDWYLKPQKLIIRRIYTSVMPIYAGRGCAWNCDFCAANTVWKANKGKSVRLRSVNNVINEMLILKYGYGVDFFYMFDDTFGFDKEWMAEFFQSKNKYLKDVPYACQTRVNLIDEDLASGLKESGCIQVDLGVESGSPRLLQRVHKRITIKQVRQAVLLLQQAGLRYFFTMLLNLPGETRKDLKKSWNLLKELKPTGVIFGITTPYPGTKIFSDHFPQGLKKEDYSLLTGNRLDPLERFRMADHKLDLWELFDQMNMKYGTIPIFEKMWPRQPLYWKAVWGSRHRLSYLVCWLRDIPKTFLIWLSHLIGIYRRLKGWQRKTR